jgi:hypothetical protein
MLAAGTLAHALQLICRLPSAKDGSLLETLKIAVGAQGAVSVWRKWERTSYWDEHEKNERVLECLVRGLGLTKASAWTT